jgi:hypothetical protein
MSKSWTLPSLALIICATFVSDAIGGYQTGFQLLSQCESADYSVCLGYIEGIVDITSAARQKGALSRSPCIPMGAPAGQLRLVVIQHLRREAKSLHFEASLLVYDALMAAFPCSEGG